MFCPIFSHCRGGGFIPMGLLLTLTKPNLNIDKNHQNTHENEEKKLKWKIDLVLLIFRRSKVIHLFVKVLIKKSTIIDKY